MYPLGQCALVLASRRKTGGYNLEQCQGKDERLLSLILLIAIAYTCAVNKGQVIGFKGLTEYI